MAPQTSWSFDPPVLIGVLVLVLLYAAGWRRAHRPGERHPPSRWRALLFAAGIVTILAALVSPLDSLGDQLMVMHMVQHMLLLDVAPILLILGLTKVLLRPVTRRLRCITLGDPHAVALGNEPVRIDRRALRASWRHAAEVRPTSSATASKGNPKMSCRMKEVRSAGESPSALSSRANSTRSTA